MRRRFILSDKNVPLEEKYLYIQGNNVVIFGDECYTSTNGVDWVRRIADIPYDLSGRNYIKSEVGSLTISGSDNGYSTMGGNIMSIIYGDNAYGKKIIPQDCNAIFHAPKNIVDAKDLILPATTLSSYCYSNMFFGCNKLISAPELPATTLAEGCYADMFEGCTSLTKAPKLPATTLDDYCYCLMFKGCTSLAYIKMLATDISAGQCLANWVNGVSPTGTFVKSKDATWDTTPNALRDSGVPAGWAVITEEEESNPLNVILNINANNGEEGVRVYNYISEKAPWISSAFDNLFIEGLYEGSMLSAKVVSAIFMGNTLVLSYEGQGHYDMCNLFPDGYLELVFND